MTEFLGGVAFTVNVAIYHFFRFFWLLILFKYIVGLGLLAIPYSFVKGGLVLGCLVMFLVTILSYITAQWILEVNV